MNRGIYTATTALLLNQKRMDVISNNLANTNTSGFKKDLVISESFPEVLLSKMNDGIDLDNHKPFDGVKVEKEDDIYRLSINSGYFRVKTPAGTSYNRELKFILNEEGYLKTFYKNINDASKTDGENYILGKNGPIKVEDKNIEIDSKGNVLSNGQSIDNLITFAPLNVIGTTSAGIRADKVFTDFTQGNLIKTGNDLDFALKGDGFFKVQTDSGPMYTRDGSFTLNNKGELITTEGYFVLGQYGSIIVEGKDFTINETGEIIKDGEAIDKLDIVKVENSEDLRKQGNNLYKMLETVEPKELEYTGHVLRGYMESSNVNTIKEMVNMITIMRNYESSQRVVKTLDDLLGRAVNDIAKL